MNLRDLPAFLLTTTGRKTGRPRTQPLLYGRDGDAFVVVGSNWGQAHHPAWSGNLLANPDGWSLLARQGDPGPGGAGRGAGAGPPVGVMRSSGRPTRQYEERAGRHIRVFRLERR